MRKKEKRIFKIWIFEARSEAPQNDDHGETQSSRWILMKKSRNSDLSRSNLFSVIPQEIERQVNQILDFIIYVYKLILWKNIPNLLNII